MHPLFSFLFIFGYVARKILIHPSVIKLMPPCNGNTDSEPLDH